MAPDSSFSKDPVPPRATMINSLAGLKGALQPGAVVTMTACKRHPDSDLVGVPRTVVRADAVQVGFDTFHADGSHVTSYLQWPKDDAVEFTKDGFITRGATYRIDKKMAAITVTCANGH